LADHVGINSDLRHTFYFNQIRLLEVAAEDYPEVEEG
jgi:hypothetical protein